MRKLSETHRQTAKLNGKILAARFKRMKEVMTAEEITPLEFDNSPSQEDLILSGSYGQILSFGSSDY